MTNPLAPLDDDRTDADTADGSQRPHTASHDDRARVFSRVLAHDASTVLAPMAMAADTLLASGDASAMERARVIANGCRRLESILRRLMEPEAARGQEPVHLNALITNLVSTVRALAGGQRQVLTRLEEPMRPVWIDPIDLEGALLAFLLDARGVREAIREASDACPLVLSTSAAHAAPKGLSSAPTGDWVVLEIEDRSGATAGAGALAGLRQAARRAGGDIEITRNPGEGTRVRTWLPVSAYGPSTRAPADLGSPLRTAPSSRASSGCILSFPPFRLDRTNEILWRGDAPMPLRAKPFTILRYLAEHPQRLVTQRELVEAIWGNVVTSDSLLRTHVRQLRRVIGEGVIETIIGRGYRFVLEVTQAPEPRALPRRLTSGTYAKSW
jgi:DNA-binding winged helix-turn-helix (wHTH) protein